MASKVISVTSYAPAVQATFCEIITQRSPPEGHGGSDFWFPPINNDDGNVL